MDKKLKNCPFCGEEMEIDKYGYDWEIYHIRPKDSHCILWKGFTCGNKRKLISKWNKRSK